ncbi:hypothetical protein BH10CYA1_BH10CYA1_28130 [soil metagenome]
MRICHIKNQRSQRGALGSTILLFGIGIALLFACIAVDIAHFVSASTEMQSVVDAAALSACYDLQWKSVAADMNKATTDAKYMISKSSADLYSPSGISIPTGTTTVSFSSQNGGINNTCTVSMNLPIVYIFAPIMIGAVNGQNVVGVSATAEQLPIAVGPAPPWYLETTEQLGPNCPAPLPSPAPAPPISFPSSSYVTFADVKGKCAKGAPPILPTYWVDMGLSDLSTAKANPNGIRSVIQCLGACVNGSSCTASNPIQIGVSEVTAVHGAYNSSISDPKGNLATWTGNSTVLLPIATNGLITGVYAVQLTGPYVANSSFQGQGVFGEFQVKFLSQANTVPGVTVLDPTQGGIYASAGSTVATLIK